MKIRDFFLSFAHELAVFDIDRDDMAGFHLAGQYRLCDKRLDACLQVSFERSCAEHGVKAMLDDELLCGVGDLKTQGLVGKTLFERLRKDIDDAVKLCLGEGLEADDLVKTVEKLRSELSAQLAEHAVFSVLCDIAVIVDAVEQILTAEVRGHDDDGVLEVDRSALRVGNSAIVKDLQQNVENIRVSLLDLIEQDDGIGLSAHGFGQLAALVIADISGRCTDKAGD